MCPPKVGGMNGDRFTTPAPIVTGCGSVSKAKRPPKEPFANIAILGGIFLVGRTRSIKFEVGITG